MKKSLETLFSSFNIYLFSNHLKTTIGSDVILLYPISSRNLLSLTDIEKIIDFFTNKLKMEMSDSDLGRVKQDNRVVVLGFFYDILYRVEIFLTFYKNDGKKYYFLNFIEIHKEGEKMEEILRAKAERDMKELEELMRKRY